MRTRILNRLHRVAPMAALVVAGSVAACSDFLVAENPGAIEATDLNDPRYASLIANGVQGEFQPMVGFVTWWNAIFTDELFNRAVFFEEGLIDRRDIAPENGTYSFFYYGNLHRTRFLAEDGAARLRVILGDTASRDLRLARTLAYGGLTYVYFAEALCEVPIDLSAPLPPDSLFERAIVRFDEAIAVATAARDHFNAQTPVPTNSVAAADSLINFARVGAARAYLGLDDKPKAIEYASQVAANFEFRAYFSANSTRENNWMWNRIGTGIGNNGTMANTPFDAIVGDPRIPRRGGTGVTAPIPHSPPSYSSYTGTLAGATFVQGGFMRIASSLEAQYIVAEAEGPTAATNTFVNTRRAAGMQLPVTLTGDELMAELREQRKRDFYLDNHRLGDLRRYKRYYGIDMFPKGLYPGTTTGETYKDDISCWPLPISEINDNPNVPKPYTPPPGP